LREQGVGGVAIIAARDRHIGQLAVPEGRVVTVLAGQRRIELAHGVLGARLAGLRGQRLQVGQPPAAPGSLVQQAAQLHQVLLALRRIRQRGPGALLRDLDARAQDLARQVGALHRLHARQHGQRLFQPAGARVLFGQHAHESGVVGRDLPPGFEVGHGQPVDGAALAQQAFAQGLAREHQRQADPHHRGESQHQRRRQQPLALNRRSGLRLVAWHGSDR
jgi:hypothetical protein